MALRIVYMGSPEFAVAPLNLLLKSGYAIVAIVTVPDKPSGRGQKITFSPVKSFAVHHHLSVLQPENLSDPQFIQDLRSFKANLQIVVAFRILPEVVWAMPLLGTFNLHASLLPQYRGAAPINWAIINGETETGLTTFFLDQKIDTGKIIFTEKVTIGPDETFGELHDRLMESGSHLVIKTVRAIETDTCPVINQSELITGNIIMKKAPKIHKEDCCINWDGPAIQIHNFIRGLSPWPGAFTELLSPSGERFIMKVFRTKIEISRHGHPVRQILTDNKSILSVALNDGILYITELQLASKNKMTTAEFLKGFRLNDKWSVL